MELPSLVDIGALGVTSSPWVSELKKMSQLHFNPPTLKGVKEINNIFATIFSGALYLFVSQSHPDNLMRLWPWWAFFGLAVVSAVIVLGLLLWAKEYVEDKDKRSKLPVMFHTFFYISLFCSVTMGFGLLKLLEDHVHLAGRVVEDESGLPIKDPSVLLFDADSKLIFQVKGDDDGYVETLIRKEICNSIQNWKLRVSAEGYNEARMTIVDCNALLVQWRKPRLRPQRN